MRAARLGLLVLIAVATASQVAAAQTEVTARERFQLFNNCEPMYLIVEDVSDDAVDIGLTRERLQFAVESRLRSARLYTSTPFPFLSVAVTVLGVAFNLNVQYFKQTVDVASGESYASPTWGRTSTGTHSRDPEFIVSALSGYMDQFLTEYLRVNEAACER